MEGESGNVEMSARSEWSGGEKMGGGAALACTHRVAENAIHLRLHCCHTVRDAEIVLENRSAALLSAV
jgi:hypothetical protein